MGKQKGKIINKILALLVIIFWITAPMIFKDLLFDRGIIIPNDIGVPAWIIWYAIPLVYIAWRDRDEIFNKKRNSDNPSYTDKGQNDWN